MQENRSGACGCRKAGPKYSIICANCSGQTFDDPSHDLDLLDNADIDTIETAVNDRR